MDIKIKTNGFNANKALLRDINLIDTQDILRTVAENIIQTAKNNLSFNGNVNSGNLISSIQILNEASGSVTVGSEEPYAGYIEYGRGPVTPTDPNGWLHWIDPDTGKDVFAKFAKATEPSPFFEPAVIVHTNMFSDIYIEMTNEMAKRKALIKD